MAGKQSDKFTFGMGDESAKPIDTLPSPQELSPAGRQKIPVAIYVLLGILIIIIIAAYFDLYRRVTHSKSTGTQKLTRLAEDLDHRFSSLSIKQAKLEEQLSKKISADVQVLKALKTELKQARADLKSVKNQLASKADKENFIVALTAIDATKNKMGKIDTETKLAMERIKTMQTELGTVQSEIRTTKENISGEMAEMNRLLDRSSKTLIELDSRIDTLNAAKIDKKAVDGLIKKHLETQQSTSAAMLKKISAYRDQINANQRQITELKKNADLYEGEILKIKRRLNTLRPRTSGSTPKTSRSLPSSTPPSPVPIKSGEILQQNLKE